MTYASPNAKAKKVLREAVERAEREIEAPQAKIDALAGSEKREDHFCSPARAVPGVRAHTTDGE
jgi:hypothetical protein